MLSLERLQNTVARSVLGKPHFGLSPLLSAGGADPYRRLRIYQNNTRASLTATLVAVFPVTVRLVDECLPFPSHDGLCGSRAGRVPCFRQATVSHPRATVAADWAGGVLPVRSAQPVARGRPDRGLA